MARRTKKPEPADKIEFAASTMPGEGGGRVSMKRIRITEMLNDAPGRPTSRNLILEEAKRRLDAGDRSHLGVLAYKLSEWLSQNHPTAPRMLPRVVENNIRSLWRSARKKNIKSLNPLS